INFPFCSDVELEDAYVISGGSLFVNRNIPLEYRGFNLPNVFLPDANSHFITRTADPNCDNIIVNVQSGGVFELGHMVNSSNLLTAEVYFRTGSKLELFSGSVLRINEGSQLIMEPGSELIIHPNAQIFL